MALPFDSGAAPTDSRAVRILAKTLYRELRAAGLGDKEVVSVASELLSQLSHDVRGRSAPPPAE
ncbi:MAG: hypothetical protein IT374_14450 [Polyangiaceae bacterium]|nr:hypothetical protein [Polyangiaceae bacterium]